MKKRACAVILICILLLSQGALASTSRFAGGSGTEEDPFQISSAEQLDNVREHLDAFFIQVADIDLQGREFTPIGTAEQQFSGVYDGDGHVISNFKITSAVEETAGLFGNLQGMVKNLVVHDAKLYVHCNATNLYVGSIAGRASYNSAILNCSSDAEITASVSGEKQQVFAGGLCAQGARIETCVFSGAVSAKAEYVGAEATAGGIAAMASDSLSECRNTGTVTATGFSGSTVYAGGLAGSGYSRIENCFNQGAVRAECASTSYAGGMIGKGSSAISSCRNQGSVYAETRYGYFDTYAGGIAGENSGMVSFCENFGYVSGYSTASNVYGGGITGYNKRDLEDCYNMGAVLTQSTTNESRAGGIAGTTYRSGTVRRCWNEAEVVSDGNGEYSIGAAGGVVGLLQYGNILQCYNIGKIMAQSDGFVAWASGIAGGASDGTITDCFNQGDITIQVVNGKEWDPGSAAGIYTGDGTACVNTYNIGKTYARGPYDKAGGISMANGSNSGTQVNCYCTEKLDDPGSCVQISRTQAANQATYAGFNFEDIWKMENLPVLKTIALPDDERWYAPLSGFENFAYSRIYRENFIDFPDNAWYTDYVCTAYRMGLIDGTSAHSYQPDQPLTVGAAVKLAACVHSGFEGMGCKVEGQGAGVWYQPYVDYAVQNQIISAGQFDDYTRNITREEFTTIFAKALPEETYKTINKISDGAIPDVRLGSNGADMVYLLYRSGIVTGTDGQLSFHPEKDISRGEVAAILCRLVDPAQRKAI